MKEEWRPVVGFEDKYIVSNFGAVKSLRYEGHAGEKELRQATDSKRLGYKSVYLYDKQAKRCFKSVHQLVASAFIPNPNGYREVNHIDGDPSNNRVDNLEWCNRSQNIIHASKVLNKKMGTRKKVLCIETGEIFESGAEAARAKGLHKNAIPCVLGPHHQSKTTGGYHWKYI